MTMMDGLTRRSPRRTSGNLLALALAALTFVSLCLACTGVLLEPAYGATADAGLDLPDPALSDSEIAALGPPPVSAKSVVLMDARTGEILYERNPRQRRAIASTTKTLTALLAIENGDLQAPAATSKAAAKAGGSSLYLRPGHVLTREQHVWALMLRSANDSAVVLAESISGSVPAFAVRMNQRAKELGATDSHFTNPNGMPDPKHFSTALDLARITRHAMTVPMFRKVVGQWSHRIPGPQGAPPIPLVSHNFLLKRYEYATGVKTGFTNLAGNCLISSAKKNGTELILVILGGPSSDRVAADSEAMLEYGFSLYGQRRLVTQGERLAQVYLDDKEVTLDIVAERPFSEQLPVETKKKIVVAASKSMELPIRQGEPMGEAIISVGDRELGRVPIVAAQDVERPSIFQRASRAPRNLFASVFGWFGGLF